MNKLFGNNFRDIPYINRLKTRTFFGLTMIVILINLFIAFSLNFKKVADESLFNPFIIVDLQHDLKRENIENIETYILSLKGVSSARFMDKSESFRQLQDDLNISIPESTNPLADSITVYLKDISLTDTIQENLEGIEGIKEVYKENSFFEKEEEKGLVFSFIQLVSIIIAFFLSIVSIILFNMSVGIEFLNSVNTNNDYNKLIRICKIRNLLSFSAATLVGTLAFFNIYAYFRKYIFVKYFDYAILSLWEIFIWHILAILFLNFVVWIIPASISKINKNDGGDEEWEN